MLLATSGIVSIPVTQTYPNPTNFLAKTYQSDGDTNGIFYHLGAVKYGTDFINPAHRGEVYLKTIQDPSTELLSRYQGYGLENLTNNQFGSATIDEYVSFELRGKLARITSFVVAGTYSYAYPANSVLSASNDGINWDVLLAFTATAPNGGYWYSGVFANPNFYSFYKIAGTPLPGQASYATGIEFYGDLVEGALLPYDYTVHPPDAIACSFNELHPSELFFKCSPTGSPSFQRTATTRANVLGTVKPNDNWQMTLKNAFSNEAVAFNGGAIGYGDEFCLEYLVYLTTTTLCAQIGSFVFPYGTNASIRIDIGTTTRVHWKDAFGGPSVNNSLTTTLAINTWYHVALTRSGTTAKLYINGVLTGTITNVPAMLSQGDGLVIKGLANGIFYLANVRMIVGSIHYTGNFTPNFDPWKTY